MNGTEQERIVFFGTPDFAVASLQALIEAGVNIVGVITSPDRKAGRGMKLQGSPVKKYAENKGLYVLQPTNLRSEQFLDQLKELNATLQVIVAFRMLPEAVWNMPPKGTFNLHASLLPQYRGAAPINWAIINGETETGVTTFFLQHAIDTGNIIFQEKIGIGPNETAGDLHDRLMQIGAELVVRTANAIACGEAPSVMQPSAEQLKPAPKLYKDTCRIDWNKNSEAVHDHIRGLSPYPTAFTELVRDSEKVVLKVFQSIPVNLITEATPGSVTVSGNRLFVRCADGDIELLEVQLAGKKRMSAKALLLGFDPSGMHAH